MFDNLEVALGSECDEKLFQALKKVLSEYGTELIEKNYSVVGSQEIITWETVINNKKVNVCSETYEGLSIKGPKALVHEIKTKVAQYAAI